MTEVAIASAIKSVYDAAAGFESWNVVAERIGDVVGQGTPTVLQRLDSGLGGLNEILGAAHVPHSTMLSIMRCAAECADYGDEFYDAPVGEPFIGFEAAGESVGGWFCGPHTRPVIEASEAKTINLVVAAERQTRLAVSADLPANLPAHEHARLLECFKRLFPFLQHASRLSGQRQMKMASVPSTILNVVPLPAIVLSQRGKCLALNPKAEALLDGGPIFIDRHGCLRGGTRVVEEAVSAIRDHRLARGQATPVLHRIADFGPSGNLYVCGMPYPHDTADRGWHLAGAVDQAQSILFFASDKGCSVAIERALCELYGLDAQDAAIVCRVALGVPLQIVANDGGLGLYDARLRLEQAMDRMGARRYVDLTRLVLRMDSVMPTDDGQSVPHQQSGDALTPT